MEEPVFLIGAEREGMLLLGLMLDAHPEIAWGREFDWAVDWEDVELGDWPPLIPYWQRVALSPRVRELGLTIDPTLGVPDLVRSLLDQQRARRDAALFGATAQRHADRLLRLWPRARFLYLQRSAPRSGEPRLADSEVARLRDADREWRRIAAEIAPLRRLELRYEELVSAPSRALEQVCAFLGVRFDANVLSRPLRAADASRRLASAPHVPAARRIAARLGEQVARVTAQLLGD